MDEIHIERTKTVAVKGSYNSHAYTISEARDPKKCKENWWSPPLDRYSLSQLDAKKPHNRKAIRCDL
jgi:hypothetical protein